MTARETIYTALFGLVSPLLAPGATLGGPVTGQEPGTPTALQPFNIISRETIEVQRVDPALQPVLFMDEAVEEYMDSGAGIIGLKWTVYFHVGCTSAPGTPAATILNPLLDLLFATMTSFPPQLGLGDLVTKSQFAGMSVKNLGQNSTDPTARQAVAYVPFVITLPPT
jgi:hypothetical protein